ncbi:MAG: twitching motility protein PilT [Nitrospinae bacterium RIFCSPLOWO2_12_FULL_45_22]|nr:MAG: twitching motility protein PilT [Nitrospinae bacterium RIFCSPLOWO2_12_FULL_45_22]
MKIRTYVRGGLLVIFTSGVGYYLLLSQTGDMTLGLWGAVIGAVVAGLMIYLERGLEKVPLGSILYGGGGLVLGLILANLLTYSLFLAAKNSPISSITKVLLTIFLGYMGAIVGMKKGKELAIEGYANNLQKGPSNNNVKILDTSVIIDGRIADICETGFIEGELVVPQFVLKELQHIADSSDTLRRNRGRRGLDILHKIQKNVDINVQIIDQDFSRIKEVDAKLVALGKVMGGKILTNDFNLNKIAELQGVPVLNINQLANAVKPVVLPGEVMNVFVLKEGKEYGQGVAYLDDGTMVVIDNARRYIGKNIEVSVTSVLQTTAGRMIFARLKDEADRSEEGRYS